MVTDAELEQLLPDLESDRVERKESAADGPEIRQAICGFANDLPGNARPGILMVGVSDSGRPTGLPITDKLLLDLSGIRAEGQVLPFPSMDVQKRTLLGHEVAVVIVHPSDATPVKFKGQIWIRSGPRRGIATRDDERRLNEKRRYRDVPFDLHPVDSADPSGLDELVFRRVYLPSAVDAELLRENDRSLDHQLAASKFIRPGPNPCCTVPGLLVVGKAPTDWLPGAYVQFLRVDGTELGEPVRDAREIRGPPPDLFAELEEVLRANVQTAVDYTSGPVEVRGPDYPMVAVQQVARNAILHRTYEDTNAPVLIYWFADRIEVHNPGGPFGRVTRENFGQPGVSDYRNPNLAAAMKELGYVQRFGSGIALARREMARNGNPSPEFQVQDSHVAAILRRRP